MRAAERQQLFSSAFADEPNFDPANSLLRFSGSGRKPHPRRPHL
jgi:hypothetical protein